MKARKHYTGLCGIDVGKRKHVACVLDRDGQFVVRSQAFKNDAEGYACILARLAQAGGPRRVLVGMEATGHYWYGLHDFLVRAGYAVSVLNPVQTAQQAKKGIRKRKTDRIDAHHIATLIKNSEDRPALVPGELAMTCRQLTRQRYSLVGQGARLKQRLRACLHPVWPEYEDVFATPFCVAGRTLLATAPTPTDVLALDPDTLVELLQKASRGRFGPGQAETVRRAAESSVGMRRGLDGTRVCIRSLLAQLEALRPIRTALEAEITALADWLPDYLFTLPGVDGVRAASLFGETDPIEAFRGPEQLVAFAGLDLVVVESAGRDLRPRRHISKRGSPYLRETLWLTARSAVNREGDLRAYWLRRRREGLHYTAAVVAVAVKLCHIVWRILTDRRNYLPKPPTH